MSKINRGTIIGGIGIGIVALIYFLTRNNSTTVTVSDPTNAATPMATIQAASIPGQIVIPPAAPNYLTYNFGPSHDLSTIAADTTPLANYSESTPPINPNIAPAQSSSNSGCGCGCDSITYVGSPSLPQSVMQSSYANVVSVIQNQQNNYSARIG